MHSPELLKGTLQTIVLKVLKDHGKMYGYEITQCVKELSDGNLLLTEGALYPTLTVMLGRRVRKYYTLTTEGKSLVKERVNEFIRFIQTMENVLQVDFK
jgi:DNA-binding PadR family transcriptional regulator